MATTITIEQRQATIECEVDAMGLRVLPDQVLRIGGGGGLRSFSSGFKYDVIARSIPNLLQGFLLDEASGTTVVDMSGNGRDGVSANCTLKAAGKIDGLYAYTLDGVVSKINNYHAGLAGEFDGNEFTVAVFAKAASAGVWSDGQYRALFHLQSPGCNFLLRRYGGGANQLQAIWFVSPSNVSALATPGPSIDWFHVVCAVSRTNNRLRVYINGVMVSKAVGVSTAWTGALGSTTTQIGCDSLTPTYVWGGDLDAPLIYGRELAASEVAKLADYPQTRTGFFLPYGDSKTDGSADDTTTWALGLNGYPKYLAQNTHLWELPRIGVSGRTTTSALAAADAELAAYDSHDVPDWILFDLGANDANSMPSQATFEANVAGLWDKFRAKWPNVKIRYARPWVRGKTTECNNMATWLDNVAATRAWAGRGPDERVVLENGDNGVTYTSDGLHPNHAGHVLMATAWSSAAV